MPYKIVIPSRFASTRLPGKPLVDLLGKPMIQRVFEQCLKAGAEEVVVATDDERIAEVVNGFGGQVEMTASELPSGTDRIAAVAKKRGWADDVVIVNVQGDEPLIPPSIIKQTADILLAAPQAAASTLSTSILNKEDFLNPNVVKVVSSNQGQALYFSRAPIPWNRDHYQDDWQLEEGSACQRHIGIYGYRSGFLAEYTKLTPSPLEHIESLEQLRILGNGFTMVVAEALEMPGHGIDTPDDAERVRQLLTRS